ncbi:VOC family protein [Nitrosomonas europaea]|uniref:VOC family protein n=1 Tax=Nitrosomonas europaea TaxID=915 RepID=UPI0032662A88
MSSPARTGVLIYAKHLDKVSSFYEQVLGARVLHADSEHKVLQSPDVQLIIHAIPPQFAEQITIAVPPVPREEQAIKPFFTVESLATAERIAEEYGGKVWEPLWPGPGLRVRNVCDPEGNIIHLREYSV